MKFNFRLSSMYSLYVFIASNRLIVRKKLKYKSIMHLEIFLSVIDVPVHLCVLLRKKKISRPRKSTLC